MTHAIKKFTNLTLCIALFLCSNNVNAQFQPIQNLIDKLESYQNLSYQAKNKRQDLGTDTAFEFRKNLILKFPGDTKFGYMFKLQHKSTASLPLEADLYTDIYNGNDLVIITHQDSTVRSLKPPYFAYNASIIEYLKNVKKYYEKKPYRIATVKDTVIDGIVHSHIVANESDTVVNNHHLFGRRDYYIDKQTGLPSLIVAKSRSIYLEGINNFYDETKYFDYKLDQPDVSITSFNIPDGFHPPVKKNTPAPTLLAVGTMAPDWTLTDVSGKKVSLSGLKGKVVVLDFYFIGCKGCMLSIKPLNKIYEKYKNKNFYLASFTPIDSKKNVIAFEKNYNIKYPGFTEAEEVVKSYHVTGMPAYFIIDKDGRIASVIDGYYDDFEQQLTAAIEKVIK